MSKVADVRLSWTRSPSTDISKIQIAVTNDGTETVTEAGPEVENITIVVQPLGAVQFKVVVFDGDGLQATSEVYAFTLGDLETPVPASNLFHEIVGIREVA